MLKYSALALSLLALACSGDDEGLNGSGGRGGASAGGSGGAATGGATGTGVATGGAGGSTTGGAGGNAGATTGSGGTSSGGSGGAGGTTGGAGGSAGSGAGGSAGSGASGSAGRGGAMGGASGASGAAGSSGKDAGASGAAGNAPDAGRADGAGGSGSMDVQSDTPPGTCPIGPFPAVSDFSKVGPFTVAPAETAGPACTIVRPATLGENGVKHPVIAWGNGTGGFPAVYNWILSHWASHGFIVAAANTNSAGTGNEMVACLDWVEQQNAVAGSPYAGKVAIGRAGASGHSQGGGGTLMAGRDPRILATAPVMPYIQQGFGGFDQASIKQQKGNMLLLSALGDTIAAPAQNQEPVFSDTNVPVFWGTLASGNHVTFSLGGNPGYLAPTTAWFRLHLMCDDSAKPMFYGPTCTVCADTTNWTVQRKGL
jgi:hypothetical protein